MILLYHFFIDSLNTCNRADQSSTVKDDGWTLQSHIQIYESENGSLKKKRRVELPPQCKVKKKPHTALHSPSHSLISISFSRRLRSQICCLFPRGEAARAESPSVSQPRHPSTLNPSSPPHPLAPSLPPSLPPSPQDLGLSPPVRCPSPSLTPALSLSNCQMKFWVNFKCLKWLKC